MKLVASTLCHNERHRFLTLAIPHLLEFVDEVVVLDDGSTDGSYEWLRGQWGVRVKRNSGPGFFHDEGRIRNALLDFTFEAEPTHILSIDLDEFVADGQKLRKSLSSGELWGLQMREVWKADELHLWVRDDGGWKSHLAPIVYTTPQHRDGSWKIQNRKLACGRTPVAIRRNLRETVNTKIDVLHFGWTKEADRAKRYARYAEHDAGRYHSSAHLNSIMYDDKRVKMSRLKWPEGLPKEQLLERVR
jgi:glycosyltransferase involved in cell wall biosynthesis